MVRIFRSISSLVFSLVIVGSAFASSVTQKPSVIQTSLATLAYDLRYGDDEFAPLDQTVKPSDTSTFDSEKKSTVKAIAYSLLLPGAGEWYVGSRTKAKFFFGAEAAIWVGFTSFIVMKHWRHTDMIQYGNQHANAQLDGRDDAFLDLVGYYPSIYDYNTNGRATDPERPFLQDTPDNHWLWQTDGERKAFRTIKNQYREANRRSQFMLGLAALNRVISIIDVIRDVHRHNEKVRTSLSYEPSYKLHLSFHPESDTQVRLTLLTPF